MYRKIISVMSVALVVFLCFQFPVFAVTGGGKTIVSNSYSYNNGAVTVYVRVNGQAAEELYEGQHYYPHNFTVTLANNTNKFQVADVNNFSVDLYSGSGSAFASNQNAWGAEVTSYSDNMTIPRITMYPSGDLAGHVLVAFNDSDLLVLNPNETRTYNFSINFIQTENVNYTPLNGNFRYSYFTYTGTVGFYARPTSFSGNSIDDFITNESLPNSAIAYYQYLVQQGIEDQELYQTIIDKLTQTPFSYSLNTNLGTLSFTSSRSIVQADNRDGNIGQITFKLNSSVGQPFVVSQNVDGVVFDDGTFSTNALVCVPIDFSFIMQNRSNKTYSIPREMGIYYSGITVNQNYGYAGSRSEYYDSDFKLNRASNLYLYLIDSNSDGLDNGQLIGQFDCKIFRYRVYYYFSLNTLTSTFNGNINFSDVFSLPSTFVYFGTPTEVTSEPYVANEKLTLSRIWQQIQSILDSYNANVPAAEDVTDTSEDTQDVVSDQHDIESGYFEDTQTYITDTGIQNFQFDPAITGGLGGVKDDFTAVWTSCGTLAQYWIASLTIGLALSIIRHRRMFSK